MSTILSIDPGSRGCGCAIWCKGELAKAGYVSSPKREGHGPAEAVAAAQAVFEWYPHDFDAPSRLVLEWPQIYQRGDGRSKGDPNLYLVLAGIDSAIASLFYDAEVAYYVPHAWKNSVEKPKAAAEPYIIELRVRSRLKPMELAAIEWPSAIKHTWDVTDAVALGLHHLGRFEQKRVYARE